MVAYNKRMPAGIPGAITRALHTTTEAAYVTGPANAANAPQTYGTAVVFDMGTGKLRLPVAADTRVDGFLVRPYPGGAAQFSPAFGVQPIDYDHAVDIMKRGYISVLLGGVTGALKNGAVFVRKANASAGKPIGGVEAAADYGSPTGGAVTGGGNGTWTPDPTAPVRADAKEGVYRIRFPTTTTYEVTDPNGEVVGSGAIGAATGNTAVFDGQIKGTITQGGVTFSAGAVLPVTAAFNVIALPATSKFMGPAYTDGTYGAMTEIAFNI